MCVCVYEDERCPLESSYLSRSLSLERERQKERGRERERERERERDREREREKEREKEKREEERERRALPKLEHRSFLRHSQKSVSCGTRTKYAFFGADFSEFPPLMYASGKAKDAAIDRPVKSLIRV